MYWRNKKKQVHISASTVSPHCSRLKKGNQITGITVMHWHMASEIAAYEMTSKNKRRKLE